jgi:uncharacterized membrane protein (DUF2068 family)
MIRAMRGSDLEKTGDRTLRLIAVFKLIKAFALVVVGVTALKLIHENAAATLTEWITRVGLNPDGRHIDKVLGKIAGLPPSKFKELGVGSFVYAALFFIEGTGLWLGKRWAEWFTVLITGSLVPLEIYELIRHPTLGKGLALLINIAVVIYLLLRIRRSQLSRTTER